MWKTRQTGFPHSAPAGEMLVSSFSMTLENPP
jgi:hypothetical protein